jgi:aryl-alcohol dehydrogenase-like predicted oxidoreductase
MDTRQLGSLTVSLVGLGCNNFGGRMDEDATQAVVAASLDAGITMFDTADGYGGTLSEEYLGRALGSRRDEVVIATKFGSLAAGEPHGTAAYVAQACEDSLRRLGTDRIDLYQIHFPDDATPIDETLGALDSLVRAGKVRDIGCSNFSAAQVDAAAKAADAGGTVMFVSIQNQLNLLDRRGEADLLAACDAHGLGILPYFPLASGMLTGKYQRGEAPPAGTRLAGMPEERVAKAMSDKAFDVVDRLAGFASTHHRTLTELAMSWLAGLPHMASVIAGATKPEQVAANVAAVDWPLTAADRAEIDRLSAR